MSALAAAATLAEISGWTLTNLQLQKLLYLAQMFYMGANGQPIFSEDFEAWKLGPVQPAVYRNPIIPVAHVATFGVESLRSQGYIPPTERYPLAACC